MKQAAWLALLGLVLVTSPLALSEWSAQLSVVSANAVANAV